LGETRSSLRPVFSDELRAPAARVRLGLLNTFEVLCDELPVQLPNVAQRLVAFVALHERPVQREYAAGMLWPDTPDQRSAANLRSTLWRVQTRAAGLLDVNGSRLSLEPGVRVDLRVAERIAHRVLAPPPNRDPPCDLGLFAGDLLPDWYHDDWVLLERERFRQLRLRALDALCDRYTRAGRLNEALEAGLLSLAGEPLRESAHRALVRVHLADGNAVEALRQYGLCKRLLRDQLGIAPTQQMRDLIETLTSWRRTGDDFALGDVQVTRAR
jgi:DNA-binding SARP family transcriptional activator